MNIALDKPAGIPEGVFDAALAAFLDRRRLDMKSLAAELGISRATLYRRAPARDDLLGEVIWFLTRHAAMRALGAGAGKRGTPKLLAVITTFMEDIHAQPALRRLLEQEPEAALRVLTSKRHPIQGGLVEIVRALIEEELEGAPLDLPLDPATTAYLIVRVGESFMYADVIADHEPNLLAAAEVVARLFGATSALALTDLDAELAT